MPGSLGRSGQGIAIAFGTTSFAASLHSVSGTERSRAVVDTSHLGLAADAEMTSLPGDLLEAGGFTATFEWNPSFSTMPPITSAPETITITYPLRSGESSNATLAGTGYMIRVKNGDVARNTTDVMVGEYEIKWDGLTGPTYTAGS